MRERLIEITAVETGQKVQIEVNDIVDWEYHNGNLVLILGKYDEATDKAVFIDLEIKETLQDIADMVGIDWEFIIDNSE